MLEKKIEFGDTTLEGLKDYYIYKLCQMSNMCLKNFHDDKTPDDFEVDDAKVTIYLNILTKIDRYNNEPVSIWS